MNRFDKHRTLALTVIVAVAVGASLAISEIALTWLEGTVNKEGKRHLVLSEHTPGQNFRLVPPATRVTNSHEPVETVYYLDVNKDGFIEPSVIHTKPNLEIAFLGGSTTECLYVKPHNRFPYVVGRLLEQQTGLKINSLNAGKSGNNVMHSNLVFIGKVVPRQPRIAVLMQGINDLGFLRRHGTYWANDSVYRLVWPAREGVTEGLRLIRDALIPRTYRRVRDALAVVRQDTTSLVNGADAPENTQVLYDVKESAGAFESALRTFVRTAHAWGIQPVLMTEVVQEGKESKLPRLEGEYLSEQDLRRGGFDAVQFASARTYFNAVIRHVALTEGALLVDLAKVARWTEHDQYDRLHYTDTGSLKVARIIAKQLLPVVEASYRPSRH